MADPRIEPALRLKIDTEALIANWKALDRLSGSARAAAVVKADAYGLGARQVADALRAEGCPEFFVAHWSEADELGTLVEPGKLAVLHGPSGEADMALARERSIRPVINSLRQAALWLESGGGLCDLMVDTGINRLGIGLDDLGDPVIARLDIDVLHSHLACADEDSPRNEVQRMRWCEARNAVKHRRAAIANSAGIALGCAYHGDLTRPGLALYGGTPVQSLVPHIRQVATPQATLIQIRGLQPGDSVGYNATFTADRAMRIGIVSLGYADGYLRCWSGRGTMQAGGGETLPVIGRVSMDMTAIDLSAAPYLREGDWVSVDYALSKAAEQSGLSQYELLTTLGRRLLR